MKKIIYFLTAFFCIFALSSCANTAKNAPAAAKPAPRIALALGGGASKGFAHIGVIKVLEAEKIPVQIVTGTSAGSVVGSLYASGMSADRLELEAEILDKSTLADWTLSAEGFIDGQKLQDFINQKMGGRTIETFPKRFAAVATRFDNGRAAVFNYGNTGQAVRASSSIPHIFRPTRIDGVAYVDGGMVQPVPVSAAKKLGADIVIAVDITDKPGAQSAAGGFFAALNQSLNILNTAALNQELSLADIVIRPNVEGVGTVGGFDKKHETIRAGEIAAQKILPQIRAFLKKEQ